jgi:Restriction endonuclease
LKLRRAALPEVRTIDIEVPERVTAEALLASRLGSNEAMEGAVSAVVAELGLAPSAPRSVLAAVALARIGGDLDVAARSLSWGDFEDFCAMAVAASGYQVRKNVRLRKPTRQIDIVAESQSLVLVIDCKHWRRGVGAAGLEPAALAQAERATMLMKAAPARGRAYLPMLLTVLDSQLKVLSGVPVVPLHGLKEFLTSVNRFEDRFSFVVG